VFDIGLEILISAWLFSSLGGAPPKSLHVPKIGTGILFSAWLPGTLQQHFQNQGKCYILILDFCSQLVSPEAPQELLQTLLRELCKKIFKEPVRVVEKDPKGSVGSWQGGGRGLRWSQPRVQPKAWC
jgi:hypothetical protein